MKKGNGDLQVLLTGLILMAAGLCLLRCYEAAEGVLRVLPFLLIGLGCGLFGQGAGNMVGKRALKNSSEIARQLEIEQKDERNVKISHWSKAKAFDMMTFVYGALMLCFALMQIDFGAVLLLVFSYLFVEGYAVYCRIQIEKEI